MDKAKEQIRKLGSKIGVTEEEADALYSWLKIQDDYNRLNTLILLAIGDPGNVIKKVLANIVKPTKEAKAEIKRLGANHE